MEIKKEDRKTLVISVLMVVFLISVSLLRFRSFHVPEKPLSFASEIKAPSLEDIFLDEENFQLFDKNGPEESFTSFSLEEVISFDYPQGWRPVTSQKKIDHEDLEILFFAYSPNLRHVASLFLAQIKKENAEEVKNFIKDIGEDKIISIKETSLENDSIFLEIEQENNDGSSFISQKKIMKVEENTYLMLSLTFLKEYQKDLSMVSGKVFSSVQLIK